MIHTCNTKTHMHTSIPGLVPRDEQLCWSVNSGGRHGQHWLDTAADKFHHRPVLSNGEQVLHGMVSPLCHGSYLLSLSN